MDGWFTSIEYMNIIEALLYVYWSNVYSSFSNTELVRVLAEFGGNIISQSIQQESLS